MSQTLLLWTHNQRGRVWPGKVYATGKSDGLEDLRHPTVATSQNGWLEAWKESGGTRGIALDGEKWCEVLHGPALIFIPDGTAKEDERRL